MSRETNRLADVAAEAQSRYSKALEHGHAGRQLHLEMLKRDFDEAYRAWQREVINEQEADQIIHGASFEDSKGNRIDPRNVKLIPVPGNEVSMTYEIQTPDSAMKFSVRQEADIDGAELSQQEYERDQRRRLARVEQRVLERQNRGESPEQTIMGFPYREMDLQLQPKPEPKPEPKGEPIPEPGERFIELDDEE